MAGAILQPLLIIKINTKRDYLIRRSSAAPPDAPVNSYKAIMGPFKNDSRLLEQNLNLALNTVGGAI
jgi:hypothetical protein